MEGYLLIRFILGIEEDESDELDESEVGLDQFFALDEGEGLENVALGVDPDAGEALLGGVEYFGDVPQFGLGVEHPVGLGVLLPELPALRLHPFQLL